MREPLGAYGDAKQSIVILATEPHKWRGRRVEVVGTIGDCRRANDMVQAMAAADPSQIVMVGGYCHTSLATTIRLNEILPTRPIRQR
jgi:hypothetical protein